MPCIAGPARAAPSCSCLAPRGHRCRTARLPAALAPRRGTLVAALSADQPSGAFPRQAACTGGSCRCSSGPRLGGGRRGRLAAPRLAVRAGPITALPPTDAGSGAGGVAAPHARPFGNGRELKERLPARRCPIPPSHHGPQPSAARSRTADRQGPQRPAVWRGPKHSPSCVDFCMRVTIF